MNYSTCKNACWQCYQTHSPHAHMHGTMPHPLYLTTSLSTACCLAWAEAEKETGQVFHGGPFSVEPTSHLSVIETNPTGYVGRPHPQAHGNQEVHSVWCGHCTHSPQTANGRKHTETNQWPMISVTHTPCTMEPPFIKFKYILVHWIILAPWKNRTNYCFTNGSFWCHKNGICFVTKHTFYF